MNEILDYPKLVKTLEEMEEHMAGVLENETLKEYE